MTASKAQIKANEKYNAKAYDRLELKVIKGNKEIIQSYCREHNTTVNSLITELLTERLKADGITLLTRQSLNDETADADDIKE